MRFTAGLTLLTLCAVLCGCEKAASIEAPADSAPTPDDVATFLDAASKGNTAVVRTSLNKGMPVNMIDADNNNALLFASFEGHVETMQALIDAGADVNQAGTQGSTPLMMACGPKPTGFPDAVKLLLDSGADVNATDTNEEFTALMYASIEGLTPIASMLIKAGADPTMQDIDGDTAADFARQGGFPLLADRLQALIDQK
jgi:uncharacterized protein